MIKIKTEELVKLKEQGMSYAEISKYITDKGIEIEASTVAKRLYRYYKEKGGIVPRVQRIVNISDEELIMLKELGISDKKIAEYLESQGIKISSTSVGKRLINYYNNQGKPKPRAKKEIDISDKELVSLREEGKTYLEITQYFINQGKSVSTTTVNKRIKQYYEIRGEEDPVLRHQISDKELVELKEMGLSDPKIAEHLTNKGKNISDTTVARRLIRYYRNQGKPKPSAKKKIEISDEELISLREKGMTYVEIAQYFTNQGKSVTSTTVNKRVKQYYEKYGEPPKKRKRKYEDDLKEILMQGITAQEFISEFGNEEREETIEKKLEKLTVIAQHSKKINNNWIPDNDFINLIKIIQGSSDDIKRYEDYTNTYVCDGICNKGQIDTIKDKVFNGNTDLMMYVVSRLNIEYYKGYDMRIYRSLNEQYKEKVDNYLNRLYSIEKNRKNKLNSENDNNLILEEEER